MSARRWLAGGAAALLSATAAGVVALVPQGAAVASPALPAHLVTGYWQDFTNGATALRLSAVPAGYTIVAVAFASATATPGAVSFSLDSSLSSALGGYTDAQFKADVATLHSRGQKVVISIGGQDGTVSVADSTSATNFANSVYDLMQTYGFDGVDIDLENGVNATYMAHALQSLSGMAGSSLVITMAPQTIDMQSTGMAYFQLALNIKTILTIVNMQYYNSGTMNGCNGNGNVYGEGGVDFLTALACIQLQGGLRPDQVGLGLPASTSGAGSGYVAPTVVDNALDCLAAGTNCGSHQPSATWPGIRGAMTWSINWDASNGYSWVNTVSAHLATLPGGMTTSAPPTTTSPAPTTTSASPTATPTTTSPTTSAPAGALSNGGFESGLSPWTCQPGDSVVTSPVHSGSHALAVVPSSSATGECDQSVHLAASHPYTLKVWVQGPYAYVGITGGPSTWASSAGWTQLSVPFSTDASGNATVYVHGWYGQPTVYADDVTVR